MTAVDGMKKPGSSFFASVGALTASRVVLVVSQIAILPVIARFLTAADFGAFALAMSVVIFSQILSDAGLGRSLIRQPEVDELEWSSVFWLLAGVGAALSAVLLVTAPLWAWIFDMPQLNTLIPALSVVPFLAALSAVPGARMERDGRFPALALLRTVSSLLALGLAMVLAIRGAGAWALVAQQVSLAIYLLVGSLWLSAFRPMRAFSSEGLRPHIVFARDTVGTSLLFTAQSQAPLMMIGYVLGAAPLGLFEMARRLLNFPQMGFTGPASQVIYVRMTRALPDLSEVGAIYVATIHLFALILIPPMVLLAAGGEVLFPAILSERWGAVAGIFLMAMAGFTLDAIVSAGGTVFQAAGRTTLRLRMQTERSILRILAIAIAVPFGIEAVALTISVFALLYTPRYWQFIHRVAPFDRVAATRAMLISTAVSLLGAGLLLQARSRLDPDPWNFLAMCGLALAVTWAACALLQFRTTRQAIAALGAGFR